MHYKILQSTLNFVTCSNIGCCVVWERASKADRKLSWIIDLRLHTIVYSLFSRCYTDAWYSGDYGNFAWHFRYSKVDAFVCRHRFYQEKKKRYKTNPKLCVLGDLLRHIISSFFTPSHYEMLGHAATSWPDKNSPRTHAFYPSTSRIFGWELNDLLSK